MIASEGLGAACACAAPARGELNRWAVFGGERGAASQARAPNIDRCMHACGGLCCICAVVSSFPGASRGGFCFRWLVYGVPNCMLANARGNWATSAIGGRNRLTTSIGTWVKWWIFDCSKTGLISRGTVFGAVMRIRLPHPAYYRRYTVWRTEGLKNSQTLLEAMRVPFVGERNRFNH